MGGIMNKRTVNKFLFKCGILASILIFNNFFGLTLMVKAKELLSEHQLSSFEVSKELLNTSKNKLITPNLKQRGSFGTLKVYYGNIPENWDNDMRQLLEWQVRTIDDSFSQSPLPGLPHDIPIIFKECGAINAYYNPREKSITMCYELMADYAIFAFKSAPSPEQGLKSSLGGTIFVFVHELGHALIDILNLPVLGKEEDAVDQLATIMAANLGTDGTQMAIIAASRFREMSNRQDARNIPFWNQHPLSEQRYYNIICWLYGSNPDQHSSLATLVGLPASRAQRCPSEYQQALQSWARLLNWGVGGSR